MKVIKLGDLCYPSNSQVREDSDTLIDYIDISSVDNQNKRIIGYQTIRFGEAPSRARKRIKKGDILVSTVRPNLNAVALVEEDTPNISVASTGFCVLTCKPSTDKGFLFHYCKSKSFINAMVSQATGASYPAVSDKIVREAMVPSYGYEEQCHIRTILDLVSSIIGKRKKELEQFDSLIKARFVEMFGRLNDTSYQSLPLDQVCEFIKDGTHQTPTYTNDTERGYKFLSSKDVTSQKISWSNIKYIPEDLHNELYARLSPRRGDILLAKNGTTGIAAVVDTDEVFDIYVSLALLRPNSWYNSIYLWSAINSDDTKIQFNSNLKGIGVPNLHLGEIKKAKIIVSPLNLQEQFADFVKQIDKSKVAVQKALDEAQLLFDSLMQEYFG